MIKGNSMGLYKIVLANQSEFFLSACGEKQAKCIAAKLTSIPIVSVVLQDD